MATLKELRDERIRKLEELRKLGIDPYSPRATKDYSNNEIKSNYEKYENTDITLTGRLMSFREHGGIVFADLVDESGKIQLYVKSDELKETDVTEQTIGFDHLGLLDVGDFIQSTGTVTKTKAGEISLLSKNIKLLTKSLRPLPDQHEGLKDMDTRYRRRYLDLIINPEVRQMFDRKSKFWEANRKFLKDRGFIEVETPILEHVTGGADAKPFVTHHDALDENFFLRISTELFLKRLVGGGYEKVFTLGPNFRNEGLSDEHLQEYYAVEWYWAYADYRDNMKMIEEMFKYIATEVYGTNKFEKNGHKFDLSAEWEKIDYAQAIKDKFNVDIFNTPDAELEKVVKENGVKLPGAINRNRLIDNLWKLIRKNVSGPAFLINEPKFMSPLAKSKPENPLVTERFHIILAGSELGNGYTELNDPFDQLDRFREQQAQRDAGDDEAQMLDIDYVEMLEFGMPPTSGYGHSERLFWFLEGVTAREGTIFPQMRYKLDETTKEIYGIKEPMKTKKHDTETSDKVIIEKIEGFTKEIAHELLEKHVQDDYQKLHAKMVANALEAYANKMGENAELWYITGLLHDLDYFEFPDEHPNESIKWFKDWGFPEELITAVAEHAFDRTGVEINSKLGAALTACDELSGFIYAYALMRPEGLNGMEASSIKKKFKDKAFAKKVSRDDINKGIEKFGVDFTEHVLLLIEVFQQMKELQSNNE